jgi:hypothetical protein
MTLEEAIKVASVCEQADSNCEHCVKQLTSLLNETFPDFTWTMVRNHWLNEVQVSVRTDQKGE